MLSGLKPYDGAQVSQNRWSVRPVYFSKHTHLQTHTQVSYFKSSLVYNIWKYECITQMFREGSRNPQQAWVLLLHLVATH